MATKDTFGDQRLKKDAGDSVRGARDDADVDRVQQDGSALSAAERRRLLRQEWVQEVLPTPPKIPGFHCCWLSTTNSTDPVFKRIQRGYVPVKASDLMMIYHHDMPMEQEAAIRDTINNKDDEDSSGRRLGMVEGDFNNLGRGNNRTPTFIS